MSPRAFAPSIDVTCAFCRPGESAANAFAAPGASASAAARSSGGATARDTVSRVSSTSMASPPPMPVSARLSALNGMRYRPPIGAIVER